MSWEIQRQGMNRKQLEFCKARSTALRAAWAIYQYESIAMFYLHKKYSHTNNPNKPGSLKNYSLF